MTDKADNDALVAGETFIEPGDDYWTADINVHGHHGIVQCYGKTEAEAKTLRDRILAALRTPQPDETETLRAEVARLKAEKREWMLRPCKHIVGRQNKTDRPDLHHWQTEQSEWFDATILEIVGEYAAWRDVNDIKGTDHGRG